MSYIIGEDNNPLVNFTLNPGDSMRLYWWGFGNDFYNVGFAFPPSIATVSNRVTANNHGMEYQDQHGIVYTVDLQAEESRGSGIAAAFRVQIGALG